MYSYTGVYTSGICMIVGLGVDSVLSLLDGGCVPLLSVSFTAFWPEWPWVLVISKVSAED